MRRRTTFQSTLVSTPHKSILISTVNSAVCPLMHPHHVGSNWIIRFKCVCAPNGDSWSGDALSDCTEWAGGFSVVLSVTRAWSTVNVLIREKIYWRQTNDATNNKPWQHSWVQCTANTKRSLLLLYSIKIEVYFLFDWLDAAFDWTTTEPPRLSTKNRYKKVFLAGNKFLCD